MILQIVFDKQRSLKRWTKPSGDFCFYLNNDSPGTIFIFSTSFPRRQKGKALGTRLLSFLCRDAQMVELRTSCNIISVLPSKDYPLLVTNITDGARVVAE